jgi:hypothetical protein
MRKSSMGQSLVSEGKVEPIFDDKPSFELCGVIPGWKWVPTLVWPTDGPENGGRLFAVVHLLTWVGALVTGASVNFTAANRMNTTSDAKVSDYEEGVHHVVGTIGTLGGVSIVLAVCVILFASSVFTTAGVKERPVLTALLSLLSVFGTMATLFVTSYAASSVQSGFFIECALAAGFTVSASVMLAVTMKWVETASHRSCFVGAIAFSAGIIIAASVTAGEVHCPTAVVTEVSGVAISWTSQAMCTQEVINVAYVTPLLSAFAIFVEALLTMPELNRYFSPLHHPLPRILITIAQTCALILSGFLFTKISFPHNLTASMFSLLQVLCCFTALNNSLGGHHTMKEK